MVKTEKTMPPSSRSLPSLCVFASRWIIATGGQNYEDKHKTNYLSSVDYYDIEANLWLTTCRAGLQMKKPRIYHSSCVLGDFAYVLCGSNFTGSLRSIERLNAYKALACSDVSAGWKEM